MVLVYHTEYNIKDVTSRINLQQLPIGDLDEKVFFLLQGNDILVRSETQLIQENCWTLNEQIYYGSFGLSVVDRSYIKQGTAWQDWQMFDYDTCGEMLGDKVIFSKVHRKKINLKDHLLNCANHIDDQVKKIKNYELPTALSYSQGIDSLVILSYLHKYDYHKKVKLIHFTNPLGTKCNLDFSLERQLGFEVELVEFKKDDLYGIINKKDVRIACCYISSWLLEKYANYNLIFGFHGNQIFCHKDVFLHETTKKTKTNEERNYSKHLYDYNPNLNNQYALSTHCLNIKPWDYVKSYYNGRLIDILANESLFDSVRSVDWTQVENGTIINAELPRQIINLNVGSLFDNLITNERVNEIDTIKGNHELDIDKLDHDILKLKNLRIQNTQGYHWLNETLENALANKKINFGSVISLLNIRRLGLED